METIEDNKLPTVTDNEATSPKDVLNRVFSLIDNVGDKIPGTDRRFIGNREYFDRRIYGSLSICPARGIYVDMEAKDENGFTVGYKPRTVRTSLEFSNGLGKFIASVASADKNVLGFLRDRFEGIPEGHYLREGSNFDYWSAIGYVSWSGKCKIVYGSDILSPAGHIEFTRKQPDGYEVSKRFEGQGCVKTGLEFMTKLIQKHTEHTV